MSTTSMILLLVTVTMVTASPANERNLLADAVGKMKASQNAMDLIVNFNDLADKYVCSLTGAKAQRECPGIQDYSIELHLLAGNIDCTQTPDNQYCVRAKAAGGSGSDEEALEQSLVGAGDGTLVASGEDFVAMKAIRKGLVDLVCELDTADVCQQFRDMDQESVDLEDQVGA